MTSTNSDQYLPVTQVSANKTNHRFGRLVLLISILLTLASGLLLILTSPKTTGQIVYEQGRQSNFTLPSIEFDKNNTQRIYAFGLNIQPWTQTQFHVFADDCIKTISVNGQLLDIFSQLDEQDKVYFSPERGYCNFNQGIDLDFGPLLQPGINQIEITVSNTEGILALILNSSIYDPVYLSLLIALHLGIGGVLWWLFAKTKLGAGLLVLFVVSFALKEYYLTYSEFFVRSHDLLGSGHWGYIEYISKNWSLPRPSEGWAYYHPPLYYFLAAVVMSLSQGIGLMNTQFTIVVLSLLLFAVFQIFGLLTIRLFVKSSVSRLLFSGLFLFWPATLMYASRINNDTLLYPLFAAGLYFVILWWQNRRQTKSTPYLLASATLASLAIITKSSGIILAIIIVIVFGVAFLERVLELAPRIFKRQKIKALFTSLTVELRRLLLIGLLTGVIITAGLLYNYGRSLEEQKLNPQYNPLIGNVQGLNKDLLVTNQPANYFYIDLNEFFAREYTAIWPGQVGRDYFWNNFIKTSVAGEFEWPKEERKALMQIMSATALVFLIVYIWYLLRATNKELAETWILILTAGGIVGGLLYTRYQMPYSPIQDFRYAVPLLIPVTIGLGRFAEHKASSLNWLVRVAGIFAIILFIVVATRFYTLG